MQTDLLAREAELKEAYAAVPRRRGVDYPRADQVLHKHAIRMELEKVQRAIQADEAKEPVQFIEAKETPE